MHGGETLGVRASQTKSRFFDPFDGGANLADSLTTPHLKSQWDTLSYMTETSAPKSMQRSFRLSAGTADLLDRHAARANESRNALADRLLSEGLRRELHPLITFRTGAAGRREPYLGVSRLKIRQIVTSLQANGGNLRETAELFELPISDVEAACSYYAEFASEIDADIAWAEIEADEEHKRWQREQSAFA